MAIVLRRAGARARPLLHTELDGNFSDLDGRVTGLGLPLTSVSGSQSGAASGRSWKLTGSITGLAPTNGWNALYINVSAGNVTITPQTGTQMTVTETGVTTATSVTVAPNKAVSLIADGTRFFVFGDVVSERVPPGDLGPGPGQPTRPSGRPARVALPGEVAAGDDVTVTSESAAGEPRSTPRSPGGTSRSRTITAPTRRSRSPATAPRRSRS